MDIVERFLKYTQFDTQSAEDSDSVPSTPKQLVFADYLRKELESEGLSNVEMDERGYIYATLKATPKPPPSDSSPITTPAPTAQAKASSPALSVITTAATSSSPKASSAAPASFQSC